MRKSILLIFLVTLVSYFNIFSHEYVWDDGWFVDFPGYQPGSVDIPGIFAGEVPMAYGQVYRPLRGLWYVISIALTGKNVTLFHLQGVLTHLAISIMVYWVVREITLSPVFTGGSPLKKGRFNRVALVTALLFGAHPIHTEAVSWITASFDTIGIAFMFGSLIAWMKEQKRLSLALAALAFFTYELTFVLVPILFLTDRILNRGIKNKEYGRFFILIASYFVTKALLLPPDANELPYLFGGFFQAVLFVPVVLWSYIKSMFLLWPQSTNHLIYPGVSNLFYADNAPHYPQLTLSLISLGYLGSLVALGGLGWLLYLWGKKNRLVWFAGMWTTVSLLPVLQLMPLNSVFAERYTYIASVGVCLLIALVLERVRGERWAIGVIGLLVIMTIQRNQVWATTVTLWEDAVKTGPPSAYAYRNLGASYYIYKDYDQAIMYYLKAQQVAPTHLETYRKLVYLYGLVGNTDQAQLQMKKAQERENYRLKN